MPSVTDNLARLQKETEDILLGAGLPTAASPDCLDAARRFPLFHSTTSGAITAIATDKDGPKLLSPENLLNMGKIEALGEAEIAMETTGSVFLYCGQFRYPNTQVGLIFDPSLEQADPATVATPFDSGSLYKKVAWPTEATETPETKVDFLARHNLLAPGYRDYLALRITWLFGGKPELYVAPKAKPLREDPIGLEARPPADDGDARQWTFEIRVPDEVSISKPHLVALRDHKGGAHTLREPVIFLYNALEAAGVDVGYFERLDDGDFAALQRAGLEYLEKQGMVSLASIP